MISLMLKAIHQLHKDVVLDSTLCYRIKLGKFV